MKQEIERLVKKYFHEDYIVFSVLYPELWKIYKECEVKEWQQQ